MVILFTALMLIAAGCSGTDDSTAGTTTSATLEATTTTAPTTTSSAEADASTTVDPLSLPPPKAQESAAIIDRIDRGRQPCALETTASGRVFVTYLGGNDVAEFDPTTGEQLQRIRTGTSPCGVAAVGEDLWVAELGTDRVVHYDVETGESLAVVELNSDPWDLQPGAGYLWVAERDPGALIRIDPDLGTETGRVDGLGSASGLVVADGLVWLADELNSEVVRIDPETLDIVDRTTVGTAPKWFGLAEDAVWVSTSDGVSKLDITTGETLLTVEAGDGPLDLVVTETDVWVPDSGLGVVYRIDPSSGEVSDRLKLTTGVYVIEPVAETIWVLNFQFQARGHIHRLDPNVPFN